MISYGWTWKGVLSYHVTMSPWVLGGWFAFVAFILAISVIWAARPLNRKRRR